jgi:hypothetical protein
MGVVLKSHELAKFCQEFPTIDEHRLITSALHKLFHALEFDSKTYYPVDVGLYAEQSGLTLSKAYREILGIIRAWGTEEVVHKLDKSRTWYTRIIYDIIGDDDLFTIQVRWNIEVIGMISGKQESGKFATYDSRMTAVGSNKRYLMYELLQRNMYKLGDKFKFPTIDADGYKYFELSLDDIREATNTVDRYPAFKDLNVNLIIPTLEDMQKLIGISLESLPRKVGKAIRFVSFRVVGSGTNSNLAKKKMKEAAIAQKKVNKDNNLEKEVQDAIGY